MQKITKRLIIWAVIVVILLIIPLVAMQFTNQVVWTISDFIFAGVILFGSALIYELTTRNMKNTKLRIAIGIGVLIILVIIWVFTATGD